MNLSVFSSFDQLIALDPAALQEACEKADQFQASARSKLFSRLSQLASECKDPSEMASLIEPLTSDALAPLIIPDTPEFHLLPHASHFISLKAQINTLEAQAIDSRATAGYYQSIQEFEAMLNTGQLSNAARCLLAMQKTLHEAGGHGSLHALRTGIERCSARMEGSLDEAAGWVLTLDPNRLCVRGTLPPSGTPSREFWLASKSLGRLDSRLASVADMILKGVLEPLLSSAPTSVSLHIPTLSPSPPNPQWPSEPASLQWSPPLSPSPPLDHTSDGPEANIRLLLKLISEHLFDCDEELLSHLGKFLWSRASEAYVRIHAEPVIRHLSSSSTCTAEDLSTFCTSKIDQAQGLEDFAQSLGLAGDDPYLVPCVESLVKRVMLSRQGLFLGRAREMILVSSQGQKDPVRVGAPVTVDESFYNRLMTGKVPDWEANDPPCGLLPSSLSPGTLPPASAYYLGPSILVNPHSIELIKVAEGALKDAVASGDAVAARSLVETVSKIALMAQVLPDQEKILQVPTLALLHHNDLVYISDCLLLMPICFGLSLPQVLSDGKGEVMAPAAGLFLQDALKLKKSAASVLKLLISSQQRSFGDIVSDLLVQMNRLGMSSSGGGMLLGGGGTGGAQAGIGSRKAVRQLLHSLGRLSHSLTALGPETLVNLASQVLGGVSSSVVASVLSRKDIDDDEGKEIKVILQPLAEEALPTLLSSLSSGGAVSGVPLSLISAAVVSNCVHLRRLVSLIHILDAKMAWIVEKWQAGALRRDGWSRDEVTGLMRALFEDSSYRAEGLSKIK